MRRGRAPRLSVNKVFENVQEPARNPVVSFGERTSLQQVYYAVRLLLKNPLNKNCRTTKLLWQTGTDDTMMAIIWKERGRYAWAFLLHRWLLLEVVAQMLSGKLGDQ